MENASKALIMAASVMIALMIGAALILMFNSMSEYQKTGKQGEREAQVVAFNNQYETYNRKNVRGSDLYSLFSKVIDYNTRKSESGTGSNQGQDIAYQPMKVTMKWKPEETKEFWYNEDSLDDNEHIIAKGKNEYIASETNNSFKDAISNNVQELENGYGEGTLVNLTTSGLTNIFLENIGDDDNSEKAIYKKSNALKSFKTACKKNNIKTSKDTKYKVSEIVIDSKDANSTNTYWEWIKKDSEIRKDAYRYYEYIQFKRAKFNCDSVEYNQQTGRITELHFTFTGKFE